MKVFLNPWLLLALAVVLPVYWRVLQTQRARQLLLCAFSLGALAHQPVFMAIVLVLCAGLHQLVRARREGRLQARPVLATALLGSVALLLIGKYGRDASAVIFGSSHWLSARLFVPLGVSYLAFRLIQYALDCHRGLIEAGSYLDLVCYVVFLPTFPGGPLEPYQSFYERQSPAFDRELFVRSLRRIPGGYFKKYVLADFLLEGLVAERFAEGLGAGPGEGWLFVGYCFLRAYLDLSALTDLAIGYAGLFGFRIMENFAWPFWQPDISSFWRSWHISLSSWCRHNVYFPVFGATRRTTLALYATMITMGVWHYLSLNWLCWGVYHASGMLLHARWVRFKKKRKRLARWTRSRPFDWGGRLLTVAFVALGYAFVGTHEFADAMETIARCLLGPVR